MSADQVIWGLFVFTLAWVPAGFTYLRLNRRLKKVELAAVRAVLESDPTMPARTIETYNRLASISNTRHECLSPKEALAEAYRLHGIEAGGA